MKALLLAFAISATAALPLSWSPQAQKATGGGSEDGFVSLFNGKDLSGWVPVNTAPSTWQIKDGMLHCTGKPIGELRTERMYQNFVLELEWRHLKPAGNGGIFVWADDLTARGQPFHRGIEVQVLDHAYGNTRGYTTHGDIFPIHGATMTPINGRGGSRAFPTENRSNPSPEWNRYRITCVDGAISLEVNGKLVTRGENCSPRKGYICLESEGGVVDYRNIRLRELPDTPIAPEHVAIENRGYVSLYTGVDLEGWRVEEGTGWSSNDWRLVHEGPQGAPRKISTKQSFTDVGFLVDLRLAEGSSASIFVRGVRIPISPKHPFLQGRFEPGWNRFEGKLEGDRFTLSLNGHRLMTDSPTIDLPESDPIELLAEGKVEFANLFTRPLSQ